MALKERLIQLTLKARDLFSGEVKKSASAVDQLTAKAKELKEQLADTTRARGLARTLRDNEQAAQGLERAMQDAQGNLADLTREIEQSESVTAGQSIALREAQRAVEETSRAYERNQRAITNVRSELKALGVNVESDMTVAEQRLTARLEENKRALDETREAIKRKREEEKRAAAEAQEHASRVAAARAAMAGGVRTILAYAAAYVSLDAAIGLAQRGVTALRTGIGTMLQVGDDAEAMQARMTSLMGSIAAGEKATAWISEFAKATPLATAEVIDAFVLLKSYGLDPMDGTLQALVDKNEQLGGGMERLTGIVTAVGQAWAKGKLQGEEILQLVERGVPVWDMLARITGKNTAQLEALASQGRLGRDVIKALTAELGKSAEGAAAAGMSRLSGLMSQLSDTAKDFYQRIANAGALDFVKGKLQGVLDTLKEMDGDGRLDRLAKALSDAFIQGAEKAEVFVKRLAGVDFKRLVDDGAAWLSSFGQQIDDAATRVQLFFAPFRTLFNWLGSGFNALALSFTGLVEGVVAGLQQVAKLVPDAFGGKELQAGLAEFRAALDSMQADFVAQVEQNNKDVRAAWDTTSAHLTKGAQDAAVAQADAAGKAGDAWEAAAGAGIVSNDAMRDAIVQAAIDGADAIDDMAEALGLIDTASAVGQLEGLKDVLFQAWQEGRLSLEEYQVAHNATVEKIRATQAEAANLTAGMDKNAEAVRRLKKEQSDLLEQYLKGDIALEQYQAQHNAVADEIRKLGASGRSTATAVAGLADEFESLADVQRAIASAQTDVEFNKIRAALRKLFEDGTITGEQYNAELQKITARQKELKGSIEETTRSARSAGEQLTRSQQMYKDALEDSILTNEELRRVSGARMEEERRASGELMEMQRRGQVATEQSMDAFAGYYEGVMNRARGPLAGMSEAALQLYDRLRGINSVGVEIDTSNLEATRASLDGVNRALEETTAALAGPGLSALGKWQLESMQASQKVQQAFLGQKLQLQELLARYESGAISAAGFVKAANAASQSLDLLDGADLSALNSALASARQQMQALGDSAANTLNSLQIELARVRGETEAAERLQFQQRRRDLEAQLAEARTAGNGAAVSDLRESLSTLQRIEEASARQRAEQAREQQQREQQDHERPAAPTTPQPAPAAPPPTTVVRLEAAGRSLDVQVPQGQQDALLDILGQAGLRTL